MRARVASILLFSGLVLSATRQPASAGGWDMLEPRREHYLVGQHAVVAGEFAANMKGSGRIQDGPYYAYLLVGESEFSMIDPPIVPAGAIRLGVLDFTQPHLRDGWMYARARLGFTVPDVPSGTYAIGFCNDPCRSGTIGWLGLGRVTIVHTVLEARLMGRNAREGSELRSVRHRLRTTERRARATNAALADTRATARSLDAQVAVLSRRPAASPAGEPARRPAATSWVVVVLAACVALLAGLWVFAPRTRREWIPVLEPHPSPEDLESIPRVPEGAIRRG